jgi:hypothetical protein
MDVRESMAVQSRERRQSFRLEHFLQIMWELVGKGVRHQQPNGPKGASVPLGGRRSGFSYTYTSSKRKRVDLHDRSESTRLHFELVFAVFSSS